MADDDDVVLVIGPTGSHCNGRGDSCFSSSNFVAERVRADRVVVRYTVYCNSQRPNFAVVGSSRESSRPAVGEKGH